MIYRVHRHSEGPYGDWRGEVQGQAVRRRRRCLEYPNHGAPAVRRHGLGARGRGPLHVPVRALSEGVAATRSGHGWAEDHRLVERCRTQSSGVRRLTRWGAGRKGKQWRQRGGGAETGSTRTVRGRDRRRPGACGCVCRAFDGLDQERLCFVCCAIFFLSRGRTTVALVLNSKDMCLDWIYLQ
jgi:hypothetical protein